MSGARPPDVGRLVEVFERHGVEYLLVGGVAATGYGASRTTTDADAVVRRSAENLDAVGAVLRELHAYLVVEGLSDEESKALPVQVDGKTLSRMEISTWRTDVGDVDILVEMPDATGRRLYYEDLLERAVEWTFGDPAVVVRAAALDDIIASKEWANRDKDHDALRELYKIRDGRVGGAGPDEGRSDGPGAWRRHEGGQVVAGIVGTAYPRGFARPETDIGAGLAPATEAEPRGPELGG